VAARQAKGFLVMTSQLNAENLFPLFPSRHEPLEGRYRQTRGIRVTTYRVFIGSPQGLDEERSCFRDRLNFFSRVHGPDGDVAFHPVGWEDTLSGPGRPQALISEELKKCQYAIFIWHERWGSPPGGSHTSGTAEEFALAEKLNEQGLITKLVLFFKAINPEKLVDPGKQLKKVLSFKKRIEKEKKHLVKDYSSIDQFKDLLHEHLESWRCEHCMTQASSTGSYGRLGEFDSPFSPPRPQSKLKQSDREERLGLSISRNPQGADYSSFLPI
jgi:hypothetical protein